MEVTISIDDLHPEKGWGCEGDESVEYLQKLNDEFGCKFTLFIPSFYHKKYPLSEHKEWVDFWLDKDWVELASHGYYHMCDDSDRFGFDEDGALGAYKLPLRSSIIVISVAVELSVRVKVPGFILSPNSCCGTDKTEPLM